MRPKWLQLRRARILGARVYVHWSVFAVVLLLALVSLCSPIYAVISIASYLAVIVVHETGHAWGGVLAQLAVAAPILIVAKLSGEPDFGYAGPLVGILGQLNLLVALVNLAPAPGLDGHVAWRAVPLLWQWQRARTATKRSLSGLKRRR